MYDVSNRTHGIFQRNSEQLPFYEEDDNRLVWLDETFLSYINAWGNEVLDKKQFLSIETYDALMSTSNAIKYLLRKGRVCSNSKIFHR